MEPVGKAFTSRKPCIITEECTKCPWNGKKNGWKKALKCSICGKDPKIGHVVVWLYTNDKSGPCGNPFVCIDCYQLSETPGHSSVRDILNNMQKEWEEVKAKYWWFHRRRGVW